jgi:hypothetical protein
MARTWVYEYASDPDSGESVEDITFEYRPNGTVNIVAHDATMGTVELVGMPLAALMEGAAAMATYATANIKAAAVALEQLKAHL